MNIVISVSPLMFVESSQNVINCVQKVLKISIIGVQFNYLTARSDIISNTWTNPGISAA